MSDVKEISKDFCEELVNAVAAGLFSSLGAIRWHGIWVYLTSRPLLPFKTDPDFHRDYRGDLVGRLFWRLSPPSLGLIPCCPVCRVELSREDSHMDPQVHSKHKTLWVGTLAGRTQQRLVYLNCYACKQTRFFGLSGELHQLHRHAEAEIRRRSLNGEWHKALELTRKEPRPRAQ